MITKSGVVFGLALLTGLIPLAHGTEAQARGGKPHYVQDYQFSKPMHGYSGRAGEFYCDYIRLPNRKCVVVGGRERCKVVGWTLRQTCY